MTCSDCRTLPPPTLQRGPTVSWAIDGVQGDGSDSHGPLSADDEAPAYGQSRPLRASGSLSRGRHRSAAIAGDTRAADAGVGEKTAAACLKDLETLGLIVKQRPAAQHRATTWRLNLLSLARLVSREERHRLEDYLDTHTIARLNDPGAQQRAPLEIPLETHPETPGAQPCALSAMQDGTSAPHFQRPETHAGAPETEETIKILSMNPGVRTGGTDERQRQRENGIEELRAAYDRARANPLSVAARRSRFTGERQGRHRS